MTRLTITIDEDTLDLLRQLAHDDHETVSNYLRRLIREKAREAPHQPSTAPK